LKGAWNYVTPFGYSSADFRSGPAVNPAINTDLDANRPSIVAARTASDDGHSWVCDGYVFPSITNNNGTFGYRQYHMNWGWDGSDNGFFYCDNWSVTRYDGTLYDFQYNHRAIVNIHR
jgi:Peptidase C10 family